MRVENGVWGREEGAAVTLSCLMTLIRLVVVGSEAILVRGGTE